MRKRFSFWKAVQQIDGGIHNGGIKAHHDISRSLLLRGDVAMSMFPNCKDVFMISVMETTKFSTTKTSMCTPSNICMFPMV
eukprot:4128686-Karenia_brevis.AAC.1